MEKLYTVTQIIKNGHNIFSDWNILELTKKMFNKKSNLRSPVQNISAITR